MPSDRARFRADLEHFETVDVGCLRAAAASLAILLATGVATALQDEGVSRQAVRALGALA